MSKTQACENEWSLDLIAKNIEMDLSLPDFRNMVLAMQEFKTTSFWVQFVDSPGVLSYLEAHFKDESDDLQRILLEEADDSEFSLHQWLESLIILSQWLEVHGLELSIKDNIGYVSCAAASAGSGANLSHLPSLVHDLLEQYGCERAVKR